MNLLKAFIIAALLFPACCFAQFTITGRVLNQADTKPVPIASVFLSNATNGAKTGADGTFTLPDVRPGKYELVISIVGFDAYSQTVLVSNDNIHLPDITIYPKTIGLKEVTIKVDHDRDKYVAQFYDQFKNVFLGTSEFADDCKILNPDILDYDYDDATGTVTITSGDFLQIENNAMGYKLYYLLTNFTLNNSTKEFHYQGKVLFTDLKGTPNQQRRWKQNRIAAYQGSVMNFLRAAMDANLTGEGFKVLRIAQEPNPERPADDVIKGKLAKFDADGTAKNADSLAYWRKKEKLPASFTRMLPNALDKDDIISATSQAGVFVLGSPKDVLVVDHDKDRNFTETKRLQDLNNLNFLLGKTANKELTLIYFKDAPALFDANGWLSDPNSITFNGAMSRNRIAELLPVNFEAPISKITRADTLITGIAAKIDAFSATHVREKVHLHLDKQWYTTGDTIWFKAYTVAGPYHRLSTLSGVLNTELIDENNTIVTHLNLKLDSGVANGSFALPANYKGGIYRLRAYTNWMRNDSDFFYDQKVMIVSAPSHADTVLKQKPPAPGAAAIVPKEQPRAAAAPDVQFFPEGGDLVNGLRSKVAFKVIAANGMAINVQGSVTDQDGTEVASFGTQHAGMGLFPLTPQAGKQYQAKVTGIDGITYTADLPKAKDEGFTLTVNNSGDSLLVKVAANDVLFKNNQHKAFYIIGQSGGKYYYTASGHLETPVFTTQIAKNRFPSGITEFTLLSQSGEPLCARVVFIQNNDQLIISVSPLKTAYAPFEKVNLGLFAKDAKGDPAIGDLSVSVTDETMAPVDEPAEATIFTDLLLTSELKGSIEKPNYYFLVPGDKTRSDLDLLMLTQGYRKFAWKEMLSGSSAAPQYRPQSALSLSGIIKTPSGKPIPKGKVMLTSIKDHFSADTLTDLNGNFTFTDLNFADSTKVIINGKKASGGANIKIEISGPDHPKVLNRNANTAAADTTLPQAVKQAMAQSEKQSADMKNIIQLKEVKIVKSKNDVFNPTYSDNMKYSANLNGPGNANQVVLADKLIGCTKLSECLVGKLFGVTFLNGLPYSQRAMARYLSGAQPMALFVDGLQHGPGDIDNINPVDVYSIEVLTSLAYLTIYGSNAPNGALIITLKRGVQRDPASEAVDGLITYTFNGFYKTREFYSPKYDAKSTDPADNRKTIYWGPAIVTDSKGTAQATYFNAAGRGTYRIVIEGIDGSGNIGRQVLRYKVE